MPLSEAELRDYALDALDPAKGRAPSVLADTHARQVEVAEDADAPRLPQRAHVLVHRPATRNPRQGPHGRQPAAAERRRTAGTAAPRRTAPARPQRSRRGSGGAQRRSGGAPGGRGRPHDALPPLSHQTRGSPAELQAQGRAPRGLSHSACGLAMPHTARDAASNSGGPRPPARPSLPFAWGLRPLMAVRPSFFSSGRATCPSAMRPLRGSRDTPGGIPRIL